MVICFVVVGFGLLMENGGFGGNFQLGMGSGPKADTSWLLDMLIANA